MLHHILCRTLVASLLFVLLAVTTSAAQVCRLSQIGGLDAEYDRAKPVVGATTSIVSECRIHLSEVHGGVYAHSNYRTPGADYPTKIYTPDVRDLALIAENIVLWHASSGVEQRAYARYRGEITYFIDRSLIRRDGSIGLKLNDATRLFVNESPEGNGQWRRAADTFGVPEVSRSLPGEGRFYIPLAKNVAPRLLTERLRNTPFPSSKLHVINLVKDTATADALRGAKLGSRLEDGTDLDAAGLLTKVANLRDKMAVILSHVQEAHCVVVDSAGTEIARVKVADLQHVADENNVSLLILGCNSADHARYGMVRFVNSLEMAERLKEGLGSSHYYEFFEALAGDDLGVLVPTQMPQPGRLMRFHLVEQLRSGSRRSSEAMEHGDIQIVLASYQTASEPAYDGAESIESVATVYMSWPADRSDSSATDSVVDPGLVWPWATAGGAVVLLGLVGLIISVRKSRMG